MTQLVELAPVEFIRAEARKYTKKMAASGGQKLKTRRNGYEQNNCLAPHNNTSIMQQEPPKRKRFLGSLFVMVTECQLRVIGLCDKCRP